MKPQSPKKKSNHSAATEKRDMQAAQHKGHSDDSNSDDTNVDSFGEPIEGGRSSAGSAAETRRAEVG